MGSVCSKCRLKGRGVQQTSRTRDPVSPCNKQQSTELTPILSQDAPSTDNTRLQVTQDDESGDRGTSPHTVLLSAQPEPSCGASIAPGEVTPPDSRDKPVTGPSPAPTHQSPISLPLWDRANPDQQGVVARSARYKDMLKNKLDDLTEIVHLNDMWATLKALGILDQPVKNKLLLNATEEEAVERLVHRLECGPTWKLHGFIRALAKTDQPHIITLLGLNPVDYQEPPGGGHGGPGASSHTRTHKPHYYRGEEGDHMLQISHHLLPGVLQHCGSYNKSLMKASLFGYKKNIPFDLTRLYICQDVSCKKNLREKLPVSKKELFLRLFGTRCPNCLSMEGQAGTGKTSYLEDYAYEWSQDLTSCDQRGPDVPCKGHLWKLVVYISSGAIRGSAVDAIRDNLRCEPHLKDSMMHAISVDGEGVLIAYDAMDELRRKESIDSISSYVETAQRMAGKPKLLLAARDGLLSVERQYFDRELHLEGFTLVQGIAYMKQYFLEMHSLSTHPILQYVEDHSQDLEWVLTNPLRVHILSELTASEFLTLHDIKTLNTVKLFRSVDELLLKRDREYRSTSPTQPNRFYEASLKCLLQDERILFEEDVGTESPYVSLLQTHNYMDQDFNDHSNYGFPHETLFEYFSMRGLIECLKNDVVHKRGMLLWLCTNAKMRSVLQLTCGYIAQYEPQLLPDVVFIIRACLILQTEELWCEQNELTQELFLLPAVIHKTFPQCAITDGLTAEQITALDGIVQQIQVMFTEKSERLKAAGWFINSYRRGSGGDIYRYSMSPFHQFLLGCLQQLTPQQLEDVCSQTTHRLLPSRCKVPTEITDRYVTVVPVHGVRWAAVEETSGCDGEVDVFVWSPCDLGCTMTTWNHLPHTPHQQRVTYYVHMTRPVQHLLSTLPRELWTQHQWSPGLRELLSPCYSTKGISLYLNDEHLGPPLSGLLSACREVITPGHGLTGGLHIEHGHVAEEDLTGFCTWAGEVGLRLDLWYLTVVLRAGRGEEDVKEVDSAIRGSLEVNEHGWKDFNLPKYVTVDGEVLCELYNPDVRQYSRS